MIKAVVFDLDNTLVDFMKMKRRAIEEAIPAMVDAGLEITPGVADKIIDEIYKEQGIEYQNYGRSYDDRQQGDWGASLSAFNLLRWKESDMGWWRK